MNILKLKKLLLLVVLLSNIASASPLATEYYDIKNTAKVEFKTLGVFQTIFSNEVVDKVESGFKVHLVIEGTGSIRTPELYIGGIIDYRLVVRVAGNGVVKNVVITDDIPVRTIYQPNTLKIDGVYDETMFGANTITVPLNDMTSDDVHIIEFSVKVI